MREVKEKWEFVEGINKSYPAFGFLIRSINETGKPLWYSLIV